MILNRLLFLTNWKTGPEKRRYVMFAVMLAFAFIMSLIINQAEKMIREYNDEKANEPETDELLITEKTQDFPEKQ